MSRPLKTILEELLALLAEPPRLGVSLPSQLVDRALQPLLGDRRERSPPAPGRDHAAPRCGAAELLSDPPQHRLALSDGGSEPIAQGGIRLLLGELSNFILEKGEASFHALQGHLDQWFGQLGLEHTQRLLGPLLGLGELAAERVQAVGERGIVAQ